jgi:hypothetical protein
MKFIISNKLENYFSIFKKFLGVAFVFLLAISITPSFNLTNGSQFDLWTESFAGDHDEGTHSGGHSGSGGMKKGGKGQHTGGGGGHSIEDKVFRGGGRKSGSVGMHPGEVGGHSIEDKIFDDHGTDSGHEDPADSTTDHTDHESGQEDPSHSTTDHTDHEDKDHSDAKGKGPKYMGGR